MSLETLYKGLSMSIFNKPLALAGALFTVALASHLTLSATTLSISDLLQQNQWSVVDSNNQPVSETTLENAHNSHFLVKFGADSLDAGDKPTFAKLQNINPTINEVVSSCIGKRTTVAGGTRHTRRRDLTPVQREKIFKAAVHIFRLGAYENKWDEYYVGNSMNDGIVYVSDASTVLVGKAAVANGVSKKTKLLSVDNSNASQAEIDAFILSDKKSQLYFEPLSISMDDNVVSISVSNILNTAKKKTGDYERRFQNTTVFYWDIDANDEPTCVLIVDTVDIGNSATRLASWILEDTIEGGNAAARAGTGILGGFFSVEGEEADTVSLSKEMSH